jgi:trehalose 6-phosphate phosphatase
MIHLLSSWENIKRKLKKRKILLFLDFDGTLAPIAPTPQQAHLPGETKILLKRLLKTAGCRLFIVSGRALSDLRHKVGIKNMTYVGNHGFEIEGPGLRFKKYYSKETKKLIRKLKEDLQIKFSKIPGILIEDKKITLSVHYRLASKDNQKKVKKIFQRICRSYLSEKKLIIFYGKKVAEIRPPIIWNKGTAVLWLLRHFRNKKVYPIYVGDDTTDEDAFKVLKNKGIAAVVAEQKRRSEALWYLSSTKEVTLFIKKIINLLKS